MSTWTETRVGALQIGEHVCRRVALAVTKERADLHELVATGHERGLDAFAIAQLTESNGRGERVAQAAAANGFWLLRRLGRFIRGSPGHR